MNMLFICIALLCAFLLGFIIGVVVLAIAANAAQAWLDDENA